MSAAAEWIWLALSVTGFLVAAFGGFICSNNDDSEGAAGWIGFGAFSAIVLVSCLLALRLTDIAIYVSGISSLIILILACFAISKAFARNETLSDSPLVYLVTPVVSVASIISALTLLSGLPEKDLIAKTTDLTVPDALYYIWIPFTIISLVLIVVTRLTAPSQRHSSDFYSPFGRSSQLVSEISFMLRRDLDEIVEKSVRGAIRTTISPSSTLQSVDERLSDENFRQPNEHFVRELNHHLATPLAVINVNARAISDSLSSDKEGADRINMVINAADLTVTILSAYRELYLLDLPSPSLSDKALESQVFDSIQVFSRRTGDERHVSVQIEPIPTNYSYRLILAALLPLIENAVVYSPEGTSIKVIGFRQGSDFHLTVRNQWNIFVSEADLNSAGYSTKPNHNGTGIGIARRLVTGGLKGTMAIEVQNHEVLATIRLPLGSDVNGNH